MASLTVDFDVSDVCSSFSAVSLQSLPNARIGILNPRLLLSAPWGLRERYAKLVDTLGTDSQRAQKLGAPITTSSKLPSSSDQTTFVCFESAWQGASTVYGFIRTGPKQLFMSVPWQLQSAASAAGALGRHASRAGPSSSPILAEICPLCVLDFFVYESFRRTGVGKALFEFMCRFQSIPHPALLAFDRPSHMFTAFLAKHYGLTAYVPQTNNYVLFDAYWSMLEQHKRGVLPSYWSNLARAGHIGDIGGVTLGGGTQGQDTQAAYSRQYTDRVGLQVPHASVPTTAAALPVPSSLPPSSYPAVTQGCNSGPYGPSSSMHAVPQHLQASARVLGGGPGRLGVDSWGAVGALPSGRASLGGTGKRMFRQEAAPAPQSAPFWTEQAGPSESVTTGPARGRMGHVGQGQQERGMTIVDQMRHGSTMAGRGLNAYAAVEPAPPSMSVGSVGVGGRASIGGRYGATVGSHGMHGRPF